MLEIFTYGFMLRAFAAGIIIAAIAPALGTFLVARRYALVVDTLAHTSLTGIAIGLVAGIYPLYTALIAAIVSAAIIEYLRTKRGISGDVALAMFLSGGLALAVIIVSLGNGSNIDLFSYLFGSITTVQLTDIYMTGVLGILIAFLIIKNYYALLYTSFDEEGARVSGLAVGRVNTMLVMLTALTVVLSTRVVGALLVGALTVIPVITATQLGKSFRQTLGLSIAFSTCSVIGGLLFSYYADFPAGGSIVLLALTLFGITLLAKNK